MTDFQLFPVTMTDTEIYQAATKDWLGVLAQLWTAVGKPLDRERLELYARDLGDVPLGLLEAALRRVRNENIYSNVPMVGVIRKAVNDELKSAYCQTIEDWKDAEWGRHSLSRQEKLELSEMEI